MEYEEERMSEIFDLLVQSPKMPTRVRGGLSQAEARSSELHQCDRDTRNWLSPTAHYGAGTSRELDWKQKRLRLATNRGCGPHHCCKLPVPQCWY